MKLENGLDGLGQQDNSGAVGKDQAISVGGDGEVEPHEIANGRLGSHRFDPRGYCCPESLVILVYEVYQIVEVARGGEGEDNCSEC